MNISNLQAFITVAENESFSDAADILKLTQPAISKRIASLEKALSERLFDRIGRKIILTEAGRTILPKCKKILEMITDTEQSLNNLSGQVNGVLSLGTSHHIGLHHLPPIIRAYTQKYPDVKLDLHFMDSETVCEKIEAGDLELGIVTLPPLIPENINGKTLWIDPLNFVVNATHPLANEKNISISTLTEHNAILPNKNTYTREIIEKAFTNKNLALTTSLSTNYLETIKMMVSVGLGWSILPNTMVNKDLKIIKVEELQLMRKLGHVQHKQRTLSNAAIAMLSVLSTSA